MARSDALRALLARRRHLVAMRTAAQNRLGSAPPRLQTDIQAPITGLNTRLAALDDDLDTTLRASPVWREHEVIGGVESEAWRACLALGRMRGSPPEIRVFVIQ